MPKNSKTKQNDQNKNNQITNTKIKPNEKIIKFYDMVLSDEMNNWAGMEALYPKKAPIRLQKVLALTVERVLTASQKPKKKEIGEK